MDRAALKNEIEGTDWSQFDGPELYDSGAVANSLIALLELEDPSEASSVGNRILRVIGNNHAGAYYPAVLQALDMIIKIEKHASNKACKRCALAILNDLYYFHPDIGEFSGVSTEELRDFVKNKLRPYSDDSIDIKWPR